MTTAGNFFQQDQEINSGQTLTAWVNVTGGNQLFDFAWGLAPPYSLAGNLRSFSTFASGIWTQSASALSNFIMQVSNPGDGTSGLNTETVNLSWQVCSNGWPPGIGSPTPG